MNTFRYFQPNPTGQNTRDCVIRAMCAVLGLRWDDAFDIVAARAKQMGQTMDDNAVYGSILRQRGFVRKVIPMTCPDCYTAEDFCMDNPDGVFVLGFTGHVAAVIQGQLWDSWDSRELLPTYFWTYEGE